MGKREKSRFSAFSITTFVFINCSMNMAFCSGNYAQSVASICVKVGIVSFSFRRYCGSF